MLCSAMEKPVFMGEYDPEPIGDDEMRQLAAFKKSGGLIKPHSNDVMRSFLSGMARPGKRRREDPNTMGALKKSKFITTRTAADIFQEKMDCDLHHIIQRSGKKLSNRYIIFSTFLR